MATETDVLTESLEHLDFEVKCSLRTVEAENIGGNWTVRGLSRLCEVPAVALMRCRACGAAGYVCADHRSGIIAMLEVHCGGCNAAAPAMVLYEFTPLGGA